ncbi:MAG: DUF6624 domain-containing protein [Planctomycetota bacterium]
MHSIRLAAACLPLAVAAPAVLAQAEAEAGAPPAEKAEAAEVAMPELRAELLAMKELDQEIRGQLMELAQSGERDPAKMMPLAMEMMQTDAKHTARMKEIVEEHGWPKKSLVGKDGAAAAWILVQHADRDVSFQAKCLELITPLVEEGEVAKDDWALLTDRVLLAQGQKQRYGTQTTRTSEGEIELRPCEDLDTLDERRAEVGLPPIDEYLELVREATGAGGVIRIGG